MKFESKLITSVDVVRNLALIARLLIYLHIFTHAIAHAHWPTSAHIQSHNRALTLSRTHAHLHTQSQHRHTNTHERTT